ncbi:Uracil permease [Lachnellula willkommii]|uniref:Uracil permease n=1 Tax=Lachnellula willkommii TaxID=215461 RepID=A0A559M7H1_9HELO|nr:Uracil permease [Lachnellula willkommii]
MFLGSTALLLLFIIIQLPLLWLHVSELRYLFMAKTIVMPIFGLTLFIWALVAAKGFGPTFSKETHIKDGTLVAVVFFKCVTTAIGPKATLALNMPDFTRYAKYPKQVFWTQAIGLCVLVTLCGILGVTVTSACQQIYGVTTWNPLQVSVLWENRAAQFFSALCWMFAVIGTNISANSVLSWLVGTVVAFTMYTAAGKIWPMEEKFDDGQVMDDVDRSSVSNSDEEVKVHMDDRGTNM